MVSASRLHEFNHVLAVPVCSHHLFAYAVGVFGLWPSGVSCVNAGNFCLHLASRYCHVHDIHDALWANAMALSFGIVRNTAMCVYTKRTNKSVLKAAGSFICGHAERRKPRQNVRFTLIERVLLANLGYHVRIR